MRALLLFRARWWAIIAATLLFGGCTARASAPMSAELSGLRGTRTTVQIPARDYTANLLLYVPRDLPAGEPMPAVLYLHGGSHRGTDLELLKGYGPTRVVAEGQTLPFVVIAPQLAEGEIWSDAEGLIALVDELSRRYPIDPDRLYVVGMSMGGRGAWYLAYRYPHRFAAVAAVAVFQPITHWASSGRLGRLPVRAYHGDEDAISPFVDAARMHEALRAAGGVSELVVLTGRDHFIADVLQDPALYEWLLRQRRQRGGTR